MSTTKMETITKKEKLNKKRRVAQLLESPATTSATAIPLLSLTEKPRSGGRLERKENLRDTSETSPPPDQASEEPQSKKRKVSVAEIEVDISKPEPPSKKALRRLKKGKLLPPPKNGAESSPEPEDQKSKKEEAVRRSDYGIWIGNLPWNVTKGDLRTFLTTNSDIVDDTITRIHMPSPDDGKPANKVEDSKPWKRRNNKGFAYVDFSVPDAVQQAVELSEQLLSGRRVLIKDNKSFEGRPQKTKEESRNDGKPPSKRVFLGNLRFDTTEDNLKEHFEKCGAIEHIMIATFEDSGKCKGYAWVTFEELAGAESAVRGYVLIEKEDELVDSDLEEADYTSSNGEQGEEQDKDAKAKEKSASKTKGDKPAMKKLWIDKIHKRPIRREFAEDAQVRYKKRYGKDGTKTPNGQTSTPKLSTGKINEPDEGVKKLVEKVRPLREVEYRTPYAARLTGGIVESMGKKVVF